MTHIGMTEGVSLSVRMKKGASNEAMQPTHIYEVRPGKAVSNAKFRSRSHDTLIRVYNEAGNNSDENFTRR